MIVPIGRFEILYYHFSALFEDDGMIVAQVLVIGKRDLVRGFSPHANLGSPVHSELVGEVSLIDDGHQQHLLLALVYSVAVGTHLNYHTLSWLATRTCFSGILPLILMKVPVVLPISFI